MSDLIASASPSAPALQPGVLRALGGIWRLTYPAFFTARRLLVLGGLSALLGLLTVQAVDRGESRDFFGWTTGFYLAFLLSTVTMISAAGAMRDDMQSVSVDYVLTRPIRRPLFVVLRYACQMLCLQLTSLVPLAALMVAGVFARIDSLAAALPHLLFAQGLLIAAFSALGFLFGALTARYFVLAVVYGLLVEIGVGNIPTQVSKLSVLTHVLGVLVSHLPGVEGAHAPESAAMAVGAIVVFVVVSIAGAATLFSLREFTGSGTAEK